jgi:cupin 2 domain-containing protein
VRSGNLLQGIPTTLPDEWTTTLGGTSDVRVERILSRGHRSPDGFWYDQEQTEFVLLVAGAAVVEFEGAAPRSLSSGDWLEIPARVRHRVAWTDPNTDTVWLAVFFAPAEP